MDDARGAAAAMEAIGGNFAAMRIIDPTSISMQRATLELAA